MNSSTQTPDSSMTLETIVGWLRHRADGKYGGEAVSQLEHALQCATLAHADGASARLVTAALLHDIGHLSDHESNDIDYPHGELAAHLLKNLFGLAVTEPIRLHVDAKRYLCVVDPFYWSGLSDVSKRSLEWQGGAYNAPEAAAFILQQYADDAVRLRRWDDAAKVAGAATPDLDHFVKIMQSVCVAPAAREAA
jgi:phosphonate degradation associated HDIG domain protein